MNMKTHLFLVITFLLMFVNYQNFAQGVAINSDNSDPDPSAILDVQSIEKGFLPPRMTTSDRNAITSPANGLVVYDTDEESLFLYNGTGWLPLVTDSGSQWEPDGGNIFRNSGNVGIGTSSPQYPLHLLGGIGVSWFVERTAGALLRGTANINDASVGTQNNASFRLVTNNAVRMHVAPDGKIGIGTINPTARLHLVGDLRIQDGTHGAGKILSSDLEGNATWEPSIWSRIENTSDIYYENGNVGIGQNTPLFPLHIVDNQTQRGLYVDHTATAGTSYGLWARSAAISGTGIRGSTLHATGITYGVYGETESTAGTGVFAMSNAPTGTTYGVQAYTASSSGRAIYGFATAMSGTNYGIYGRTNSATGYAGYFEGGRNYFQGNVGIGETSPTVPLHIKNGTAEMKISASEINRSGNALFVISSGSDMEIESGSDFSLISDTDFFIESGSGLSMNSMTDLIFESGLALNLNSGTEMDLVASSDLTLYSPVITTASNISTSINSDQNIILSANNSINMNNNTVYILGTNGVGIKTAAVGVWALAVNGNAAKPGGGSWAVFSDARLKHNIEHLQTGMLDKLLSLNGYTFEYDPEAIENRLALPGRQTGLLAQEVQQVFPDWVEADDEGYLFVSERGLTAILVEAIRELRVEKDTEIESLKTRLEALEALLDLPVDQANKRVSLD
jgi:hypothetical protein